MHKYIKQRLNRNRAYKKIFLTKDGHLSPEAELVLSDLLKFSKFLLDVLPNSEVLNMLEGRRQVLRRIWKNINFNEKKIINSLGDKSDS